MGKKIDADKLKGKLLLRADALRREAEELEDQMAIDLAVGLKKQEEEIRTILKILDNEPAVDDWIPVEERLPEAGQKVLLQARCNKKRYVGCKGSGNYFYSISERGRRVIGLKPIAWQPLPDEYKEV